MNFADRFYSVGELADLTGYHPDSIYRAIAGGALAAVKPGGKWLIDGAAIDTWLHSGVTQTVVARSSTMSARATTPAPPARREASDARPSFRELARRPRAT